MRVQRAEVEQHVVVPDYVVVVDDSCVVAAEQDDMPADVAAALDDCC